MTRHAITVGALLGIVLAASAVYSGTKTSVFDGGNIPAAVLGFAVLARFGRPSVHDGNLVQTVASSAANMAIVGGFLGPLAAIVLAGEPLSYAWSIAWGIAVGALGCLLAIPLRGVFVTRGALPFPTPVAVANVIRTLYSERSGRPLRVLAASAAIAALVAALRDVCGWIPELTTLPIAIGAANGGALLVGIGWSPLLVAVGSLLGARMSISLVLGTLAAWFAIAPQLVAERVVADGNFGTLSSWLLWPGVAILLGGTAASLAVGWRTVRDGIREIDVRGTRIFVVALVGLGASVVVLGSIAFDVHPVLSLIAVGVSTVACAAAGRATGETDNPPAGPLGAVGQLVIAAGSTGSVSTPLVGGGIVQGASMSASVTLQNWRTGALLDTPPRDQLFAQLVGVVVGAAASAAAFAILRDQYGIGSDAMPALMARSWRATADLLQHGVSTLPPYAAVASASAFGVGFACGLLARYRYTPSPGALGMAFLLPPYLSITMALGGFGWYAFGRRASSDHVTIASGIIAGEAAIGLLAAALRIAGAIP